MAKAERGQWDSQEKGKVEACVCVSVALGLEPGEGISSVS